MVDYAQNKGLARSYEFRDRFEAGVVLLGHEVKAVRAGKVSLRGAFVVANAGGARLKGALISPYQQNNVPEQYNPRRERALLLHKNQLNALVGASNQHGLTILPVRMYSSSSRIKLEIVIGRGLKKHDQREKLKQKEFERRRHKLLGH